MWARCRSAAGGYDDERWWDTAVGRAWRRGKGTAEGSKELAREILRNARKNPGLIDDRYEQRKIDDKIYERWQRRLAMTEAEFEAHRAELYPEQRKIEPRHWQEERFNNPLQPATGICWYEVRAYCGWLSAQTGLAWRLPTEVEAEAAARGASGRLYPYGDTLDVTRGNTIETRTRSITPEGMSVTLTPVGVFVEGDTPEGASDMAGNAGMWTSSLWGTRHDEPDFKYPYVATDGREDPETGLAAARAVRGGSSGHYGIGTRTAYRSWYGPGSRDLAVGFRLVRAARAP